MRALRLRGIIACAAFVAAIMALPQLADARPSRWTAPTARPYIAFAGMPTDTGEEGLMRFQGPYVNDHKSLPLVGLEVGWPVWQELNVVARMVGADMTPEYGAETDELAVLDVGVGASFGLPLTAWAVPRLELLGGTTRQRVRLVGSRSYEGTRWGAMVSGAAGVEFRTPGLILKLADPDAPFRQLSLSLYVGYGGAWRTPSRFGPLGVEGDHDGTVVGPEVGRLELAGHGVVVRTAIRF